MGTGHSNADFFFWHDAESLLSSACNEAMLLAHCVILSTSVGFDSWLEVFSSICAILNSDVILAPNSYKISFIQVSNNRSLFTFVYFEDLSFNFFSFLMIREPFICNLFISSKIFTNKGHDKYSMFLWTPSFKG